MIPYSKPNTTDREIWADVMSTLKSGQIDPGRKHEEFRSRLADLWDVPLNWVLLTNSCTTALTLALRDYMSICAPILTWPSTYSHHKEVRFLDVDPDTGIAIPGHPSGSATVLTALWGRQLTHEINAFADQGDDVIIDSAQDLSTSYACQLQSGKVTAVCYSFGPLKEITTLRGGALVMKDAASLEPDIDSGTIGRLLYKPEGFNGQMTEIGAALGLIQLETLEDHSARRRLILEAYGNRLPMLTGVSHSGHLAVLGCKGERQRDLVRAYLESKGIATGHHYPIPDFVTKADYPKAAHLSSRILTLPCYHDLDLAIVDRVIDYCRLVMEWN